MNKIFLGLIVAASFASCQNTTQEQTELVDSTSTVILAEGDAPKVQVEKAIHEFGVITQGEKVAYEFKFKNIGSTPLIISNATATCGCTVPEYPNAPVKPGEEGIIKVIFDSAGKLGLQDKVITITSNANPAFEDLHLVGEIMQAKK